MSIYLPVQFFSPLGLLSKNKATVSTREWHEHEVVIVRSNHILKHKKKKKKTGHDDTSKFERQKRWIWRWGIDEDHCWDWCVGGQTARRASLVSERRREWNVREDNALLSLLPLEPGRGTALADIILQINATDNSVQTCFSSLSKTMLLLLLQHVNPAR